MDTRKTTRKGLALRRGIIVFLALAVLTAVEFVVARGGVPSGILWILAILKAALVINFFMHLSRLFQPDEGGH